MMTTPKMISIVGPTASGKTALSVALAQALGTQIVSSDSMQIYRYMDIGTAKPTMEEQQGIVHHLLDVCNPDESFSVAQYCQQADAAIAQIHACRQIPIVVGGTGLYMDTLIAGNTFTNQEDNPQARAFYQAMAEREGNEAVHACLTRVDAVAAARLHPNNLKRVIRALEVFEATGQPIDAYNANNKPAAPKYDAIRIGICPRDREVLYERINQRVHVMLEQGLLQEAEALLARFTLSKTAAQAIGYKELFGYFRGEQSLEDSVQLIQQRSRNYAKRQLTWFRKNQDVTWFHYEKGDNLELVLQQVTNYINTFGVQ